MCKTKVPLDGAKGMLYNGLPSFIVMWIFFDVVIIDIYCILVLAAVNDALGKLGALCFQPSVRYVLKR